VTDMRDELLERVVDELQTLPPVDEAAVGRIVRAAAADPRVVGSGRVPSGRVAAGLQSWWRSRVPLAAAAGFALAAGVAGYALRGGLATPTAATAPALAPESLTLASALPATRYPVPATVPTQFVLDAPRASRVALVGDFNAWNAAATPLARVSSSGIWTVTVPIAPGRHTYAFMVNGTAWTLDPRAPAAQDPDFGTPSSVVLVGTP
jgi:predicted carbohydrate-binding protein with CBM48